MYLDYAEMQANRGIVMYMKDWVSKLDAFLKFNERQILDDIGKISHEVAEDRRERDKKFISDFDQVTKKLLRKARK